MRRKILYGNDNTSVKKRVPLVMYVKEDIASIVERVGVLEKVHQ